MVDIAIFLTDVGGGGAERVMVNLANGFVEQGHSVDMVLVQKRGEYLAQLDPKIQLIDFNQRRLLASLPRLVRYLKQNRPRNLVSALEDTNILSICAAQLAGVGTKTVVTVHNHISSEAKNEPRLRRKIVPYLLRWFYPHANHIVAVSKGVAVDLARWAKVEPDKIQVIYNPIITATLRSKQLGQVDHSWLNQEQVPVILGIGRLHPQKDFPTLIRAFKHVREQRLAKLIILGEGNERESLEQLIKNLHLENDVQLIGFVENPQAYLRKASLCVLSSAWEGFGNILVESMLAGTPVVSTNCESGPSEILEDGLYGKLIPVGNLQAMAAAILDTLEEPLPEDFLQQRANDFSLENALSQYQKLMRLEVANCTQ
jgi:glycosyltransferase involved in cell wall biosynthesis